jgi:hypothetical protein
VTATATAITKATIKVAIKVDKTNKKEGEKYRLPKFSI